jgi:Ca-activated chloride channel family protein
MAMGDLIDGRSCTVAVRLLALAALLVAGSGLGHGQENPLDQVATPNPVKKLSTPPNEAEAPGSLIGVAPKSKLPRLRMEANLVLVPMTVTDPMNRLVTGLEADNFQIFDNNAGQTIKTFSTEDAPVTIGIVFDLSGSMQSKFARARRALTEFLRTSNPQDEFFVVGFNDKPAVIVDYTSDVDDVEARMIMLHPENRTALIDAVYLAMNKLKDAKYERKALLIVSDGGDNRSRYTEGELRRVVRESDVQIYDRRGAVGAGAADRYRGNDRRSHVQGVRRGRHDGHRDAHQRGVAQ